MSDDAYRTAFDMARAAVSVLPKPASDVAIFLASALEWAIDLIRRGFDPIKEIERIKSAREPLAEVEDRWSEELDKK